MNDSKGVVIRLGVADQQVVIRALKALGETGEAALRKVEAAGRGAAQGVGAVGAASREAAGAVQGLGGALGPFGRILQTIGPAGIAAAAGLGAVVATGAGLFRLARNAADLGDRLYDMSKQTGISVDHLSALKLAAENSGGSLESLSLGFKGLANATAAALDPGTRQAALFKLMGIQVTDAAGKVRPMHDLMLEVADGLLRFRSGAERAAAAEDIFGRGARDLMPLLVEGSAGIKNMESEAKRLGVTITETDAKMGDEFNDTLHTLTLQADGAARKIGTDLLPIIKDLMTNLSETLADPAVQEGIKNVATTVAKLVELSVRAAGKTASVFAPDQWGLNSETNKAMKAQLDQWDAVRAKLEEADRNPPKLEATIKVQGAAAKAAAENDKAGDLHLAAVDEQLERAKQQEQERKRAADHAYQEQMREWQKWQKFREDQLGLGKKAGTAPGMAALWLGEFSSPKFREGFNRLRKIQAESLGGSESRGSWEIAGKTASEQYTRAFGSKFQPSMRFQTQKGLLNSLLSPETGAAVGIGAAFAANQYGASFKGALAANKLPDFVLPASSVALDASEAFRIAFTANLAQSYADLLKGDPEAAIKGLGARTGELVIDGIAGKLAEETMKSKLGNALSSGVGQAATTSLKFLEDKVDYLLKVSWSAGGKVASAFADAGKRGLEMAGQGMLSVVDAFVPTDRVKKAVADAFPEADMKKVGGDVIKWVGGGIGDLVGASVPSDKLMTEAKAWGGTLGKGVNDGIAAFFVGMTIDKLTGGNFPKNATIAIGVTQTIISDFAENTGGIWKGINEGAKSALKGAVIGAGIGQLIGDDITAQKASIGGAIGAILGGALGQPMVGAAIGSILTGVVDKIFYQGEREKASSQLKEVLTDVQAFGGISGYFQRIGGLAGFKGNAQEALLNTDNAKQFSDLLRVQLGATQDQATELTRLFASGAKFTTGFRTSSAMIPQLKNLLGQIGISGSEIGAIKFLGAEDNPVTREGTPVRETPVGTPRPEAPALPVAITPPSPAQIARDLLRQALIDKRLSAGALAQIGWDGKVSQGINDAGDPWPTVGFSLKTVTKYGKGYSPQDEAYIKRMTGVDIVAAKGFVGTVYQPTRMLLGEAGPEDVAVIPRGAQFVGGGNSRTGDREVHIHIGTINALDPRNMKQVVEGDMMDWIRAALYRDSLAGRLNISSRAIVDR